MNKGKVSTILIILLLGIVIALLVVEVNRISIEKYYPVNTIIYETPGIDVERSNELFNLVNEYRKDNGLKPLTKSYALCRYATLRTYETDHYWNDSDPHYQFYDDNNNGLLQSRFGRIAENLAWVENSSDASIFLYGWEQSRPHNETMLRPIWNYTCVICVNETCVQEFSIKK